MTDDRDPQTGKLTVWGYTERLTRLAALLLIPILIWAVRIEVFYQQGPRFTKSDAQNLILVLREEWREELRDLESTGQLPKAAYRLDRLEGDVKTIQTDLREVRRTVQENEKKLTAIQLLLERR